MMSMFKLGLMVLIGLSLVKVQAKEHLAEFSIAGSQIRALESQIVNQEYQLLINTPASYGESDKSYPVIYFLDAQWDFPLMVSTYGQSFYDGFIPEAILVGIQWGGENPNPDVLRARDFTPSHLSSVPNSGGAEKFLQFIKQELIPFMSSEYSTSDDRILMGSSYGGLFTLYTLFTQPNLFNGYVPTASASGWDNDILYSYAKGLKHKKLTRPIKLYSAIGEFDSLISAFDDLESYFKTQHFKDVSFRFERIKGLGHASVKAAANTWGLHYVFAKENVVLSKHQLTQFVGLYRSKTTNILIEVLLQKGQLMLQLESNKHSLLASSVQKFYQLGERFEVVFDSSVEPQKLSLSRFMNVDEFFRIQK